MWTFVARQFLDTAVGLRRVALLCALLLIPMAPIAIAAAEGDEDADSATESATAVEDEPIDEEEDDDLAGRRGSSAPRPGVEEILVIGEVLESSTQAESEAITTFDQAELDALGIANVDTLALNTPSLHVGQVGQQAVITLRGVGLENLTSVGEAGVGFQIDGVHLGRPSGANAAFFDLESVDVDRGPVGTRGGRQTTGGRIALWSAKPREDLDATANLTLGNYNARKVEAVLNIPIFGEGLMTRTSVLYSEHEGYQDLKLFGTAKEDPGDAEDFAGRLQLRSLLFDQRLEVRVIGLHSTQKGNGPALKLIGDPPTSIASTIDAYDANGFDLTPYLANRPNAVQGGGDVRCPTPDDPNDFIRPGVCVSDDPRESFADHDPKRDNEQNGITGLITFDLPLFDDTFLSDLRLGFVGSHQQNIEDAVTDFDGTNIPEQLFDQRRNTHQTSFEVYLERPDDVGMWDFRTGFYYYEEMIDSTLCFNARGLTTQLDLRFEGEIDTTSYAGFGEIGLRLADTLRIYGGLRWTQDEKEADQTLTRFERPGEGNGTVVPPGGCGTFFNELIGRPHPTAEENNVDVSVLGDEFEGLTPAAGFEFQLTDTSTVGFSYSRGFKAGGFPLAVDSSLQEGLNDPYESEFVNEYELTSKNVLFDGRLTLNLTGFWTEYKPFQICQFAGPSFFCRSDGSATLRGVELEMNAEPIDGLRLNGFFNYLDTRVNDFQIVDPTNRFCQNFSGVCDADAPPTTPLQLTATDVSGNRLPKAPAWAGSLGMQYEIDAGSFGYFTPRVQTQFQGRTYFRVFNKEEFSQDPFIKFDAKIMWRNESERLGVEVFGVNLTDEDVLNSLFVGSQFTGGQVLGQYQPPRLFGVKVSVNYVADWLEELR